MTDRRGQRGFTLMELMVAMIIALVVVMAMGSIIVQNIKSWQQGRDKAVLQQNVTEGLEWMARSVRAARTLVVISATEFETYDETGALVHTYERVNAGGSFRLREDGTDLVERECTQFSVTPDSDTTSVTLLLELEDDAGSLVAARTRAAVRNQSFEF